MLFSWIYDYYAWIGLAALISLELVLGIDNLIFITLLVDRLPQFQRERALIFGLTFAMLTRIGLLASISYWMVMLQQPLLSMSGLEFSGRDIVLIIGGFFLLFKVTTELHDRLEGDHFDKKQKFIRPVSWQIIVLQIVVLDVIFSIDSIITAIGMVQDFIVMAIAVVISVFMMMAVSKPIINYISRHSNVVILCLGFLLMIGFFLIIEGLHFDVPKGYLYASIIFSGSIELLNQMARRNRDRLMSSSRLRARAADAVLRLLGGKPVQQQRFNINTGFDVSSQDKEQIISEQEKDMVQSVLTLADRPARSIMTPRTEIVWLDIDHVNDDLQWKILELGHSRFPVARGSLDNFIGVVSARDLLRDLLEDGNINLERSIRKPLFVHENVSALKLIERLRKSSKTFVMVLDEYGVLEGMITPDNILEAIAGYFPDEDDEKLDITVSEEGSLIVDGWIDVRQASKLFGVDLVDEDDRYSTLAGFILWKLGHLPQEKEVFTEMNLNFEIIRLDGHNIDRVKISRVKT
ncbi:TerC family protein [Candidatus Liberibacter americanus]|uniref:Hemolysin protein n=1 Tax=Candidatus Liberibacter americanus str. Sao Paulo TaxID=1261131 RepID=U6B6C8_9HYPH|nr:TerC family protein [Candidatus Liberibacter americanus]AHA27426.1 Hemolysin protein [Candidatus Liberibacter americanus str. Sao Paulo]EMS36699.1 integral membrane protein TerC [Candidatus Liberibacter americanus PW_SP]